MNRSLLVSVCTFWFAVAASRADEPPKGFTSLFNGKDLTGWKVTGKMKLGARERRHLLYQRRRRLADDQEGVRRLRTPAGIQNALKGNSGVASAPLEGDPAYAGMEIQLIDDVNWGNSKNGRTPAAIYNVVPPKKIHNKPIGEWNDIKIHRQGPTDHHRP